MLPVTFSTQDINAPRRGLLVVSEKEIQRLSAVSFVYDRHFLSILFCVELLRTQQICQAVFFSPLTIVGVF